jgi:actin-related protein 6
MNDDRKAWLNPVTVLPESVVGANSVVIDHGNFELKLGLASDSEPTIVANAIAKCKAEKTLHTAHQLDECSNATSLSFLRPFDKGFCVNWDLQQTILDTVLEHRNVG